MVITGSSNGLGYAMAREFLQLGDQVALCGRDEERLWAALDQLRSEFGAERVHGLPCDCSRPDDVRRFREFVRQRLGGADLWLNNAGAVATQPAAGSPSPAQPPYRPTDVLLVTCLGHSSKARTPVEPLPRDACRRSDGQAAAGGCGGR